ncbi:MAG: 1-deoxy-D-xylulose-5-phosphate reductoisomerase [Planctomycetota bacterium]|nr:1-deoxy-D-xylulose-5-phosphate reductoisomerase [Planctomycetota bacterium]
MPENITLLGATGSIGQSTLDIIRKHSYRFRLFALTANRNVRGAEAAVREFSPRYCAMADSEAAGKLADVLGNCETEILSGEDELCALASDDRADTVVSAIVGAAALKPTVAAVKAGKRVALANKESLVMAGDIVNAEAQKSGAQIIPVDSEHSAVFSCLYGRETRYVSKLVLTASGGPFRTLGSDEFDSIMPEDALKHPTWDMGAKITIDSATMFNKALEIIEAHHLFGLDYDDIEAVVHPQSIVHALVYFEDESVLAQMSLPDMRLPIQLALTWPSRIESPCKPLNLADAGNLTFEPVDNERFPSIATGIEAGRKGSLATTALNAANEVAVNLFLNRDIQFTTMFRIVSQVVKETPIGPASDLEEVFETDRRARELASRLI